MMNSAETESTNMVMSGVEFNPIKDVTYTNPKVNANSGKNVGVLNSTTKKGLYLSTPLMLTWGVQHFDDEKTGKRTYDMSIQFPNKDYPSEECDKFLKNMQALEEKFKADAITNSKEWMNKPKLSKDVVEALWTPMLKYPKDKETQEPDYTRAPTLRIKIPNWDDKFSSEIYDMDQKKLFPEPDSHDDEATLLNLIPKATYVATLIQCGGLWFANGKFGVTWRLFQAVVKPKTNLRGVCQIKLSSADREQIASQQDDDLVDGEESGDVKVAQLVEDSDDEESGDEAVTLAPEVEVEPEPAPEATPEPVAEAPKKKVVRKKAPPAKS